MNIKLGINAYGKNAVNLSKIIRHADHHEFRQVSVNVALEGDFDTAHTLGDNSKILPTDTQKNTVYALAKEHFTGTIEEFGLYLANHFITNNPQVSKARIEILEHAWQRMAFDGAAHTHSFTGGSAEKRRTLVIQTAAGAQVSSGLQDLLLLKTTDSAFENYIKDQYTVLKETSDRILATKCEAMWEYTTTDLDFEATYQKIRTSLLHTFAHHKSLSVQQTLYAIGEQILLDNEVVKEVSLIMPNKHHIPFNLEQFGMENKNEVFIATDEPFGYITGTVVRE
ncbi:factor-independent urate hydroxylase [Hymenobacter sp. GOD-10R]|uniref:factor-independent urate hydroxylase n=1 Tax=Hymenobacter sp. GOD-10R TaxID=3093922 RepID=UPI002D787D01|nr:urate oxidase [Hymenobacter sp. GOD-10R]WRQ26285.1 urate oxidase [Hymenobacter sp. GOD-10R]